MKHFRPIAALAALSLVAVACGGGGEESADSTAPSTTVAPTTTERVTTTSSSSSTTSTTVPLTIRQPLTGEPLDIPRLLHAPDGRPVYSGVNHPRESDLLLTNVKGSDGYSHVLSFAFNKFSSCNFISSERVIFPYVTVYIPHLR